MPNWRDNAVLLDEPPKAKAGPSWRSRAVVLDFDPEGSEYDYDNAISSGDKPDETGHWSSIDPRTGMILKGRKHDTWEKTVTAEKARGNAIIKKQDGRYYSVPLSATDELSGFFQGLPASAGGFKGPSRTRIESPGIDIYGVEDLPTMDTGPDPARSRVAEFQDAVARGMASTGSAFAGGAAAVVGSKPPGVWAPPEAAVRAAETAGKLSGAAKILWEVAKDPAIAAQNEDYASKALNLIGETLPYITATTASYIAAGPLGGFAAGSLIEGNSAYRTAVDYFKEQNKGAELTPEQQEQAKTIGVGVGIVSGAIEAFGGKFSEELLLKAAGKLKNKIIKGGAVLTVGTVVEALEEGSQEIAHITGEETYRDVDWNERVNRTLSSMAGGAFLGWAMRGASVISRQILPAEPDSNWRKQAVSLEEQPDQAVTEMDDQAARHMAAIAQEARKEERGQLPTQQQQKTEPAANVPAPVETPAEGKLQGSATEQGQDKPLRHPLAQGKTHAELAAIDEREYADTIHSPAFRRYQEIETRKKELREQGGNYAQTEEWRSLRDEQNQLADVLGGRSSLPGAGHAYHKRVALAKQETPAEGKQPEQASEIESIPAETRKQAASKAALSGKNVFIRNDAGKGAKSRGWYTRTTPPKSGDFYTVRPDGRIFFGVVPETAEPPNVPAPVETPAAQPATAKEVRTVIDQALKAGDMSEGSHAIARHLLTLEPDIDANTTIEISNEIEKAADEIVKAEGLPTIDPDTGEKIEYAITGKTVSNLKTSATQTAIGLYKGHDADTVVEEWYHRAYDRLSPEDQKTYQKYHDTSGDARSVNEHFAQEGRDYFFSQKLHEAAGSIRRLFDKARDSLLALIKRIRSLRGQEIPEKIRQIYDRAGTKTEALSFPSTSKRPSAGSSPLKTESSLPKSSPFSQAHQLKKIEKEIVYRANAPAEVRIYEVSIQPKEMVQIADKPAFSGTLTLKRARQVNSNPERVSDWKKIYAKAKSILKWSDVRKAVSKDGKLANLQVITLTKGCQRTVTTVERVANGILPNETRIEACYGGTCWVNKQFNHVFSTFENMEVRDLQIASNEEIAKWLSTKAAQKSLNATPFIREGYAGDSSHLFASGAALEWLKGIKDNGIKTKTVFISASYAPVSDEQYKALLPYKDSFQIHFSNSGWFHKNEIMLRLAEFQAARDMGLPVAIRLITNKDNIGGLVMPNAKFLDNQIKKLNLRQEEILETPYHDDAIRLSKSGQHRSESTGQHKYVCCETGKCITCAIKCLTKITQEDNIIPAGNKAPLQASYQLREISPTPQRPGETTKKASEGLVTDPRLSKALPPQKQESTLSEAESILIQQLPEGYNLIDRKKELGPDWKNNFTPASNEWKYQYIVTNKKGFVVGRGSTVEKAIQRATAKPKRIDDRPDYLKRVQKREGNAEDVQAVASDILREKFGWPQRSSKSEAEYFEIDDERRIRLARHDIAYPESSSEILISIGPSPEADIIIPADANEKEIKEILEKNLKSFEPPAGQARPGVSQQSSIENNKSQSPPPPRMMSGFDPGVDRFIAEDVRPTVKKGVEAVRAAAAVAKSGLKMVTDVLEPSRRAEKVIGKQGYAEVIKAIHKPEAAMLEFEEQRIEALNSNMAELRKFFAKYDEQTQANFMTAYAGRANSIEAEIIQRAAEKQLPAELRDPKIAQAIREISDANWQKLVEVSEGNTPYIKDYFYGLWKNPGMVDSIIGKYLKTTKRFLKHKSILSVADGINAGLTPRYTNYIDNLAAEYRHIARLEAMQTLRKRLMDEGKGFYIDDLVEAPVDWEDINDPVFSGLKVRPELAKLVNNLISTNKITQQPALNAIRKVNNFLRIVKFIGGLFHARVIIKASTADSGYLGFLHKATAWRWVTFATKKKWEMVQKSPEYRKLITLGFGHKYSLEEQAQEQFKGFVQKVNSGNFIGASIRGAKGLLRLPVGFTEWMFNQWIPMVKYAKTIDAWQALEKKKGRQATDWELVNIIKEGQNFYGEMNERLFGRSGTVTTGLRFIFLAPGFAEGNYRTIIKSLLQWGISDGWSASRSRSNILNSFMITLILATVGTLIFTGKPPKKPKNLEDIRDLFKIDTGRKDSKDRPVMIDMMDYDKDYFDIYYNVLRGRPDKAVTAAIKRVGGMKSPFFQYLVDVLKVANGEALYDWKGDRITEITDSWTEKLTKIAAHEFQRTHPIPVSVFSQAKKKQANTIMAFVEAVSGFRPVLTEKDKREGQILQRCWSLKGQQEETYASLSEIQRPREAVAWYNNKVRDVLEGPLVPQEMRDLWTKKLTIDLDRYLQNKAHTASLEGNTAQSKENAEEAVKLLKNFNVTPTEASKLLDEYYGRDKATTTPPSSALERDRVLGPAMKNARLKERMQK